MLLQHVTAHGLLWAEKTVGLARLPPNPLAGSLLHARLQQQQQSLNQPLQQRNGQAQPQLAPAPSGDGGGGGSGSTDVHESSQQQQQQQLLVVDMRQQANAARFIRQCADCPNLVPQVVLARDCRSPLLYYTGLFAARHVAAGEELTANLLEL